MEGMSSHLKELWEEWELRVLVLLSLTVQILLIVLGRHRKYRPNLWLQALVWSLYLSADAVAIYALGKIATRLAQLRRDLSADAAGLDPDAQMIAFWAPFLLLHLGGPDIITAYSLEDNELWLRHLLRLVVQMIGTLFIFFQALTGSDLSMLSLLIIVSGLIKYGERVYVLWAASSEQFRDSTPDPPLHCPRILEEYKLKKAEGYDVMSHEVIEVYDVNAEPNSKLDGDLLSCDETLLSKQTRKNEQGGEKSNRCNLLKENRKNEQVGEKSNCCKQLTEKHVQAEQENDCGNESKKNKKAMSERNRVELALAKGLIGTFRCLFTDLVLSMEECDTSRRTLKDKSFHVVFRVIEIELGFMYDWLYTKAMVIHHPWGFTLRSVSILATCTVLVLFSLSDKDKYSKFNIYVSFLLLSVALFLEIYALFYLLFSDEAAHWLNKHHGPVILDLVERVQPLYKRRRWSGSMGQYNLLSFALRERHPKCHKILEILHVDQKVLKFFYQKDVEVENSVKEEIFKYFESQAKGDPSPWDHRGDLVLNEYKVWDLLHWSIDIGLDQSILTWHIATELLCHPENPDDLVPAYIEEQNKDEVRLYVKMSKHLSRYMLYLLVMYPFLLPIGVGRVKFRDTYGEVMKFFEEENLIKENGGSQAIPAEKIESIEEKSGSPTHPDKETESIEKKGRPQAYLDEETESKIADACGVLRKHVNPQVAPIVAEGDKSKFALYHGRRLAWKLDQKFDGEQNKKWKIVSGVWVELLAYAAVKCKGVHHAQQLRQGGEFLTHVWLLMAHFGLTDHFQIPRAPTIAELLVKRE